MLPNRLHSIVENSSEDNASPCLFLDLPDDLLCLVFEIVAHAEPPYYLPYSRSTVSRNVLGFLRLSEVCRRVRNVLLSMPAIWASAVFRLPENPSRISLERSKLAPLPVDLRLYNTCSSNKGEAGGAYLFGMAIEHNTRMSSFTADNLTEEIYAGIFKGNTLPLLRSIDLAEVFVKAQRAVEHICVDAPNLRHARLSGLTETCYFVARGDGLGLSFKLPGLVSLCVEINEERLWNRSDANLAWFADVLAGSPLIEDLALCFLRPYRTLEWKDILAAGRKVRLPRLRSVKVTGSLSTRMAEFINLVAPHELAKCAVVFSKYSPNRMLPAFVEAVCPRLLRPSYDSLHMQLHLHAHEDGENGEFQITAFSSLTYPGPHHLVDLSKTMTEAAHILTSNGLDDNRRDKMTRIHAAVLQESRFTRIVLDARTFGWWPEFLPAILRPCATVTELVVQHLCREPGIPFPILFAPEILPSLETLFIRPVLYTKEDDGTFNSWWECFVGCLRLRDEARRCIRRVHLFGPGYPRGAGKEREIDGKKCARAARYVDELLDERTGTE